MNRTAGIGVIIAIPAVIGYGAGKLFGASNRTLLYLTIGGALLGAVAVLTVVESLNNLE